MGGKEPAGLVGSKSKGESSNVSSAALVKIKPKKERKEREKECVVCVQSAC